MLQLTSLGKGLAGLFIYCSKVKVFDLRSPHSPWGFEEKKNESAFCHYFDSYFLWNCFKNTPDYPKHKQSPSSVQNPKKHWEKEKLDYLSCVGNSTVSTFFCIFCFSSCFFINLFLWLKKLKVDYKGNLGYHQLFWFQIQFIWLTALKAGAHLILVYTQEKHRRLTWPLSLSSAL